MEKPERSVYDTFVRLDDADPELSRCEGIEVYSLAVEVKNDLTRDLLFDPLSVLAEGVEGIDSEWRVSLQRMNAEIAIPHHGGPHHIVIVFTVVRPDKHVHGVIYRLPPDDVA